MYIFKERHQIFRQSKADSWEHKSLTFVQLQTTQQGSERGRSCVFYFIIYHILTSKYLTHCSVSTYTWLFKFKVMFYFNCLEREKKKESHHSHSNVAPENMEVPNIQYMLILRSLDDSIASLELKMYLILITWAKPFRFSLRISQDLPSGETDTFRTPYQQKEVTAQVLSSNF